MWLTAAAVDGGGRRWVRWSVTAGGVDRVPDWLSAAWTLAAVATVAAAAATATVSPRSRAAGGARGDTLAERASAGEPAVGAACGGSDPKK